MIPYILERHPRQAFAGWTLHPSALRPGNYRAGIKEFRLKLYPEDFYKQREFYKDVLGFEIIHEWDREDSKGVMFNVGGTTLEFMWPVEEGLEDMPTGSGLSLEVDDVNALFDELKYQVTITHELRDNPCGDRSFEIMDPHGYKISFFTKLKEYSA